MNCWPGTAASRNCTNISLPELVVNGSMVIWLTGLAGSGKTTVGRPPVRAVEAPNTVLVDGDDIRRILGRDEEDRDYTPEGRRHVAERIHEICAWLDRQDINVICCTMSFFSDVHERNRRILSRYFEVYISVPMDILCRRDTKNLYAPAMRGEIRNVIGVDLPFTPPAAPDMVIDNSRDGADLGALAAGILETALAP